MRSIWSGDITLSLLRMPMKLGSTTVRNELGLHTYRKSDGAPINFTRVAATDGKEVPWADIVRGYTAPDGSLVMLDKADFEQAYGPKNRVANLLMFTDEANVPPMSAKKSYWVQPDTGGEKIYALIAESLRATGKVAILTFAMRERVSVAVLRAEDGYLSLEALEWDADLIRPDFTAPANTASQEEQDLFRQVIEQNTEKYDHTVQSDPSREAVMAVIQAKIEHGEVKAAPPRPANVGAPLDLVAALKASVEAHKGNAVPAQRAARSPKKETAS